ncbi:MAG TPA: enoyl-CoA hydratase/isomerase family protein, partial [Candidatus Omnitrophota bacterium]|nr:enoyl-CoA hydratase/isomerase family protein [Candidatus Omnitrophota bacterium]
VVVIEGAGERAFCAGGDIRAVWDARERGEANRNPALFAAEYRLDRLIHHYPKPIVALLDGIVMGGGAGVSVNGRFRVATERTLFAMPECAIGFFPDVGATHFLNRCPGNIGLYLGVTGTRLGPSDCLWAGLATHFVPSAELPALKEALAQGGDVAAILDAAHRDPGPSALAGRAAAVDRCFAAASLREIISNLVAEGADWSWDALDPIGDTCPFSQAVTFRQLREGRGLTFDDAIRREYRLACRFLQRADFYEGIRALVVDKDKSPRWSPQSLADVDPAEIEAMFAPLGEDELEFHPD